MQRGTGPVQKNQIARAEAITPDYVEQILVRLRAAGLVSSQRGVKGGFVIAVDPARTTVAAIISAMEGAISLVPCRESNCDRGTICVTRPLWERASAALEQVFADVSIQDLANQARTVRDSKSSSFQI
jgi:Rrf2 family protein